MENCTVETTCVGGMSYPTVCGPENCDKPSGPCNIIVNPPPPVSCTGACGGPAAGKACYCDTICAQEGDCCYDYEAVCSN